MDSSQIFLFSETAAISEGPLDSTSETDRKIEVMNTSLFDQEQKDSEPDNSFKHQMSNTASSSSVIAASLTSTSSSDSSRFVNQIGLQFNL